MGNDYNWLHPASNVTKRNRAVNTVWVVSHSLTPRTRCILVAGAALLISLGIYLNRVAPLVVLAVVLLAFAGPVTTDHIHFEREVLRRRFPQWVFRLRMKPHPWTPDKGAALASTVLKHPLLTSNTIRWAWHHGHKIFRGDLLAHDNAPLDVLQAAWPKVLGQRGVTSLRNIIAHPNVDRDTFQSFMNAAIAQQDTVLLTHFMFSHLITGDDIRTLTAAIKQDNDVARQSTSLLVIACHAVTPADVLDELALHPTGYVRAGVAENPNTSPRARTLAMITN